jgi:hypothetical protein
MSRNLVARSLARMKSFERWGLGRGLAVQPRAFEDRNRRRRGPKVSRSSLGPAARRSGSFVRVVRSFFSKRLDRTSGFTFQRASVGAVGPVVQCSVAWPRPLPASSRLLHVSSSAAVHLAPSSAVSFLLRAAGGQSPFSPAVPVLRRVGRACPLATPNWEPRSVRRCWLLFSAPKR